MLYLLVRFAYAITLISLLLKRVLEWFCACIDWSFCDVDTIIFTTAYC